MRVRGNLVERRHQRKFAAVARLDNLEAKNELGKHAQPGIFRTSLENKFQRKLNQTWIAVRIRGRHLPKAVCGEIGYFPSDRIKSRIKTRAGEAEVRVIKQIEELSAELETRPFGDRSSLEEREIKVVDAGGAQ
jgi:hypothetical protein